MSGEARVDSHGHGPTTFMGGPVVVQGRHKVVVVIGPLRGRQLPSKRQLL